MTEEPRGSLKTIVKQLVAVGVLLVCALVITLGVSQLHKPFTSAEVQFTDASAHGMAIVPASCPSDPYDADSPYGCSGTTPLCPNGFAAPNGDLSQCPAPGGGGGGCPAGSTLVNGQCVTPCQTNSGILGGQNTSCQCPTGYTLEGNECIFTACPQGYTQEDGQCILNGCPAGYTEQTDANGNATCISASCPLGYVPQNGQCIFQGCPQGYTQEGTSCVFIPAVPPSGDIIAVPSLVQHNAIVSISWSAQSVTSCTVSGTNGDGWSCSGSSCNATTTKPSSEIEGQTIYTLSCTGNDDSTFTRSAAVGVAPGFCEVGRRGVGIEPVGMMHMREHNIVVAIVGIASAALFVLPILAHAQAAPDSQLRSTIYSQIMADPRSKTMTQAQIYSMVNALTLQAEAQGLTAAAITYRPQVPAAGGPAYGTTFGNCSDISCSLSDAFGLDGSIPIIPLALFVLATLFILIFSIMREMGHPHAQLPPRTS